MSVAVATVRSDQSGVYEREELLNGCQAVAQGVRLADVDVIAAYPIRPYTEVMDALSKLIADGQFDAEYIIADSEHSQFEIVKHASSVNARAFGGSSGTGWMYGMEALVVTATDRLPPLFVVGNRALDDPGAFGVEHNDAMAVRDMGWLLCWVTTPQEALEHVLIGYRIAHALHRWRIPVLPRLLSQIVRTITGVEIHPGAHLGRGIFIDHGMGVVIGGTAKVGKDCE